jgi:hypothetical protein
MRFGGGGWVMYWEFLRGLLPIGAQLIWDDWRQQPAVVREDVNYDGREELLVPYKLNHEIYITVFFNDGTFWYIGGTFRGAAGYRVKGIDLFPASMKVIGGKKWGYINHKGEFVTPIKYENAEDFQDNGLAGVQVNGEYGLINLYGQFIVHPQYQFINPFSEGRAVVMDDKGFKVINERGKVLTSKTYSFIANYQNGRAMFSGTQDGQYLYGFLNKQGKEVIPLQYESATDFSAGKAVVKIPNGSYQLINLNGKVLHTYDKAFVGTLSEGMLAFQDATGGKYGYMNEFGETVIEPVFMGAQVFMNGRAIVNMENQNRYKYGLINKLGKYVIEPIYNDIIMLGENRLAIGQAINEEMPFAGSRYALADLDGNQLSNFIYLTILDFHEGFASATDATRTFFINTSGQIVRNLPIAKGNGTLSFEGALIKGVIDNRLRYYLPKGTLVWSQNQIITLNNRYRVIERKFNPNKDYLVFYPEIQGMRFEAMQKKVNTRLAQLSGVKEVDPTVQPTSSYTGDYEVSFFKNRLVVLELTGYDYPFGAAHGMPSRIYAHVDLESGVFYQLAELFKPDSSYVKVLSDIIEKQIQTNPEYSYVFPGSFKGINANQPFYIDENNLYIYFAPYEIAPYAAGFPTFKIPFNTIDPIIQKSGAFWLSFH